MIRVFLDYGHGGLNFGACWPPEPQREDGTSETAAARAHAWAKARREWRPELVEKHLTYDIGTATLHSLLTSRIEVSTSRKGDEEISLAKRGVLSQQANADLVISIHVNANENPEHRGAYALHWPGNDVGRMVADTISVTMPRELRTGRVFAADDDWPRVRNVIGRHRVTSVLVECGYVSNPQDREFLKSSGAYELIACAIRAGVFRFIHIQDQAWQTTG